MQILIFLIGRLFHEYKFSYLLLNHLLIIYNHLLHLCSFKQK